jgi:hypothetical protein
MAKTIITTTEFTDDLDGGKADRTVSFSVDGVTYEIDLSKKNAAAFEKVLKPYVDHARKVRAARTRGRVAASPRGRARSTDLSAIREWAKSTGLPISERGRIAGSVVEAYNAANKG